MSSWRLLTIWLGLLFTGSALAAPAAPQRVIVLNIAATGVSHELAASLSEVLVGAVREQTAGKMTVIGQTEIGAMLSFERQKDLLGCDNASCLAEIGGALGAGLLITSSLGKVGSTLLVSLRLVDTARAEVVRQASDRIEGRDDQLIEAISQLGHHLLDESQPVRQGFLTVRDAGLLTIDGTLRKQAPISRLPLAAGMHEVSLADAGGAPKWHQTLEIAPYDVTLAQPPIAPPAAPVVAESKSSYWWLWTGLALAAAGGGAAYYFTRGSGPSSSPGSNNVGDGQVAVSIQP